MIAAVHSADQICTVLPEFGIAVDALLPNFVDQSWAERVEDIEVWLCRLGDLLNDGSAQQRVDSCVRARTVVTAMLEAVPGVQIDCLDAAMLVHLSISTPWRLAAARWLGDVENTAIDGWLGQHPGIHGVFAATTRVINQ